MDPLRVSSKYARRREVFSGWKDIATYLGKGVRTVQRYERELKLPVRRPAHKNRGSSVLATRGELDFWVLSASMLWRPEMPKAPLEAAKYEIGRLQKAVAQMRTLRNAATQLRTEFSELQKNLSHQMQLVRAALALNEVQKSNEIKTLRGTLLTCSYCKKIETSPETWTDLENYVRRHSHAQFNHGVCPDCLRKETKRLKVSS